MHIATPSMPLEIAGPARSGKPTVLCVFAEMVQKIPAEGGGEVPEVWAICSRRSPLAHMEFDQLAVGEDDVAALVAQLRLASGPVVLSQGRGYAVSSGNVQLVQSVSSSG